MRRELTLIVTCGILVLFLVNPQVVANPTNAMIVVRGLDGRIYLTYPGTGVWLSLQGGTPSPPSVCSRNGMVVVVVRGWDNRVYERDYVSGSWSGWSAIGSGRTSDQPACVIINAYGGGTELHVVVRGMDNGIYHNWRTFPSGSWSGWEDVHGKTVLPPVLTQGGDNGQLHLVVTGADYGVYHRFLYFAYGEYYQWDPWEHVGGNNCAGKTYSKPAAVMPFNFLHVVVRGTNNKIYHSAWSYVYDEWETCWISEGGTTYSSPALAMSVVGGARVDLFVRGADNGIYHKFCDSGCGPGPMSTGWDSATGATIASPNALFLDSTYGITVLGTNGRIYYNTLTPTYLHAGTWSGWSNLGGSSNFNAELGAG